MALALGVHRILCATMRPEPYTVKSERELRRTRYFETVTIGRMLKEIARFLEGRKV